MTTISFDEIINEQHAEASCRTASTKYRERFMFGFNTTQVLRDD